MNIYFDMDETLLQELSRTKVRVYPMAKNMVKYIQSTDHELHALTTSVKDRAIRLINKYYPDTFKTITAREDFTYCETIPYSDAGKWSASKCINDKTAVLVDNDLFCKKFRSNGLSAQLKVDYLGIDEDRCFPYNNYESKLPMMFKLFIEELKC